MQRSVPLAYPQGPHGYPLGYLASTLYVRARTLSVLLRVPVEYPLSASGVPEVSRDIQPSTPRRAPRVAREYTVNSP